MLCVTIPLLKSRGTVCVRTWMCYQSSPSSGLNVEGVNHGEPVRFDGSAAAQHVHLSFVESQLVAIPSTTRQKHVKC